jgi:hypothetical protein
MGKKIALSSFIIYSCLFSTYSFALENEEGNFPPRPNIQQEQPQPTAEIKNEESISFYSTREKSKKSETVYPSYYKREKRKQLDNIQLNNNKVVQPSNVIVPKESNTYQKQENNNTQNQLLENTTPQPKVTQAINAKTSDWINGSVSNLDKSGVLKVPDWVDYNSYVSQKDYAIMLSKVTKIKDKKMFGETEQGFNQRLSRGMAFDYALKAFGLEPEMEKVVENYKTKFKDISQDHQFYKACLTAEILKLSAGYPNGTFRPDDLLKWSEAVAIAESVYRWASLMPEQTPIQKATDSRKYLWYYFLDAFRLALTGIYCVVSIIFLLKAWRKAKHDRTGFREIIASLSFASISLLVMWINEMLYARGLMPKEAYYIISTISVIAGLFLIRTTNLITKHAEPKPEANVEVAHVEYVDITRGEIFLVDSITKRRILALISKDSKIHNRENRLLGQAFFSELAVGDFVSVKGTESIAGGSVVNIDNLYILASKQNTKVNNQHKIEIKEQEYNTIKNSYKKAR